ncbi:MAG: sulfite exporter TauE/SafE family protein [Prolixibacteraceae bacterium]|nr:sulfite exporter TauE/SafE family protein [Prolixibacteraceae bacterium]
MDLITPLTIGLIGSFHCIGMCGPIVVALPLKNQNLATKIAGTLLYNSGRVITYSVLGILFGLLGRGIHMAGFQQWTSIVLGAAMIISVLFPFVFREKITIGNLFSGFAARLIVRLKKLFTNRSYFSLLMIGLLNGLLPCGLVYVAIAGAINSGTVLSGALFMALFGIGTIPLLLIATLASDAIGQRIRFRMQKVVPYFVFFLGVLFILRGLSLGIPYISPTSEKLAPKSMVEKGSCCK